MSTFVDDLLDLKLMREGIYSLVSQPFQPKDTFELIQKIFYPQANAQRTDIKVSIESDLRLPNDMMLNLDDKISNQDETLGSRNSTTNANIPILMGDERRFK